MKRAAAISSLVLVFFVAVVAAAEPGPARIRFGDDPRWADPQLDDRAWDPVPVEGLPMRTGPYWLRLRVRPPEGEETEWRSRFLTWPRDHDGAPIDSVYLSPAFTFDLYVDGRLVDRNGVVGHDAASEVPGTLNRLVRLPPEVLTPGWHVVAVRISAHHYNFPATHSFFELRLQNYEYRRLLEARKPVLPLVGAGGALIVTTICAVFYGLVERRRTLLLGAVLGLAMLTFYGLIATRWLFNPGYDWHCPRLTAIALTLGVIALVLPWMLIEQFALPRRNWWLVALLPLLGVAWQASLYYEDKALWMCRASLLVALVAMTWAVWRRRRGAWFVLVAVAVGLLAVRTSRRVFLDPTFFLLLDALVMVPLATLGLQLRAERQRAQEATLAAARLEAELLKKNIQPHFLINTLATIMEVIERDAGAAIALIESLAVEFRILARVSGEKLITLGQELELCRAHLAIMSTRKDARCTLEVHGVDETALVPPAVLHTLLENGLSHLRPEGGVQRFELREARDARGVGYIFTCLGAAGRGGSARPPADALPREGTGLRYVRARLEESFAGRWSLASGPIPGGWRTEIRIGFEPVALPGPGPSGAALSPEGAA